jgi:hypothetical protein
MGSPLVSIVMFGWIPVVFYIFNRYPPQRAVVICFVIAWLFLPVAGFKIPGIPAYNKMSAACYCILLATAIKDSSRFSTFKFSWLDIPMLVWCLCPFASSVTNGLGAYDGFSSIQNQIVTWGAPYYLGRIYLNSLSGLRQLAIGIFVGGLVYVPFCWFESRTFTSLHLLVYGLTTGRDAAQSMRYGGYRPQVFLEHGLMLGVWMMSASLMGIVIWRKKIMKKIWGIPIGTAALIVFITFVATRSTGAYLLFLMCIAIMYVGWLLRSSLLMWVLVAVIAVYLHLGTSGTFPSKPIVASLSSVFNAERVGSLAFRFNNEEILGARARERMLFGWGGFNRNRVLDEYGEDTTVTDSLWIIVFGVNGMVGIVSAFSALLLPVLAFCVRYPARLWRDPDVALTAALCASVAAYTLDCVLNAMVNPIFVVICGGVVGLVVSPVREPLRSQGRIVPGSVPRPS